MMRITREEEHYIGGARPALHGRVKVGFAKDGRITALDMFVVAENGPYEAGRRRRGRRAASCRCCYQPEAMRWRGVTVLTNTPPRRAQSQPGGMQGIMLMEPVLAKAARKLGHRSGRDPPDQRAGRQGAVRPAERARPAAATRRARS